MRAYFFGNFYLSSIQQGIQAAHVIGDMSIKYHRGSCARDYRSWASTHKTMILLNGGMASQLREIEQLFSTGSHSYCWSAFCEESDALENSITSVGIILPEIIYTTASNWKRGLINPEHMYKAVPIPGCRGFTTMKEEQFSSFEIELMTLINSCKLAS